jgi:CheY-like chemotaxis protein
VLVVDDEPQILRAVAKSSGAGYEVETAATGEALASAACARRCRDSRSRAAGKSGTEVTRELREWSKAPVILLGGRRRKRQGAALDAGADDCVPAPFGIDSCSRGSVLHSPRDTLGNPSSGRRVAARPRRDRPRSPGSTSRDPARVHTAARVHAERGQAPHPTLCSCEGLGARYHDRSHYLTSTSRNCAGRSNPIPLGPVTFSPSQVPATGWSIRNLELFLRPGARSLSRA